MKIPDKLKIGGHWITVEEKTVPGQQGSFDPSINTICIDPEQPQSQKEASLIHEILHVCNSTVGDSEHGHDFLDSLAEQLYQALSDNDLLRD